MPARRRLLALVPLALACAAAVAGCSAAGSGTVGARAGGATSVPPTTLASPVAPAATATSTTVPTPLTTAAWSSAARRSGPCAVGGASRLTAVRVAHYGSYDRAVFQFSGPVPCYDIGYVGSVEQDGSGRPVPLAGTATLRIAFGAFAHDDSGAPTYTGAKSILTRSPVLEQLAFAGDFEGRVSWGLGVDRRRGFHATTLRGPSRVVVDIAH